MHESAAYILRKQLEEADIILISKTDLMDHERISNLLQRSSEEWPFAKILAISSKTGNGLEDWLTEVTTRSDSGTHMAEIDYDIYAEGEAVLGWYNGTYELKGDTDWNACLSLLMKGLAQRFEREKAAIGHLKILLQNSDSYSVANLTGSNQGITLRGSLSKSDYTKITINARVQMDSEGLEGAVEEEIRQLCNGNICCEKLVSRCLSPGRPNPTFRYTEIVWTSHPLF